jgi:imidazoleglycerol-phosphate dehydratase
MRLAKIKRKTNETNIKAILNIDGSGENKIHSPIGFLTHMLETFARHGLFDLAMEINGDVVIDQHHTVEDTGIVLGNAFKKALKDKKGINRAGFFIYPMDDALVLTSIDISGRPYLKFDGKFKNKKVGDLSIDVVESFFQGFTNSLGATIHIIIYYGRNDHHKIEAIFKSFAKALKQACLIEKRLKNKIPSTKGII